MLLMLELALAIALYIDRTWGAGTAKRLYKESQKLKNWDIKQLEELTDAAKRGQRVYHTLYDELSYLTKAA